MTPTEDTHNIREFRPWFREAGLRLLTRCGEWTKLSHLLVESESNWDHWTM